MHHATLIKYTGLVSFEYWIQIFVMTDYFSICVKVGSYRLIAKAARLRMPTIS